MESHLVATVPEVKERIELCPLCNRPMQVADKVYDGEKVIALRYVCYCRGTVHHVNVHTGQKTEPK